MTAIVSDLADIAMTWSALKGMASCPAMCRHLALRPDGAEQTLAMRMGSGLAAIVGGLPLLVYHGRRAGKEWASYQAAAGDTLILNEREHATARAMVAALQNDPIAAPLLFGEGVEHEIPMAWEVNGRAYRTRGVDFIRRGAWIGELKQSRTVQPGRFERDSLRALYPCQVEVYDEGESIVTGRDRDRHPLKKYIIAVEPAPPHLVCVYELTAPAVDFARRTIGSYRSQLRVCEAANQWPGYAQAAVPFDVPEYDPDEDDDGEEMAPDAGPFESAMWGNDGDEVQPEF